MSNVMKCHVCNEFSEHSSSRSTTCNACLQKGYKWCNVCHEVKPTSSFGKKGSRLNGACKECENQRSRQSKEKTGYYKRPEVIEHRKAYKAEKFPDYDKEYAKDYYKRPEVVARVRVNSRTRKRERYQEDAAYRAKLLIRNHNRRVMQEGTFSVAQWQEACQYFNFECAYCGSELQLTMDHVVPVSSGGKTVPDNIIPACIHCNSSKSDNEMIAWYTSRPFYTKERLATILKYVKSKMEDNGEE